MPTSSSAARSPTRPTWSFGIAAPAASGRSCCSPTPTSWKPSAKTGAWTRSRSSRRTAIFYGRGTGDDKAQAAVWIANLIRYKREGFKPDRDIIVALTADEEGGGPYNGVDVAAQEQARADRRRVLPERRRLGRVVRRQADLERHPGEREVRHQLPAARSATRAATARCPSPTTRSITWPARSTGCRKFGFPLKTNDVTQAYFRAMSKIETGPVSADLAQGRGGDDRGDGARRRKRRRRGTRRCAPPASRRSSKAGTRRTRCRSSPPRTSTAACCPRIAAEYVTATLEASRRRRPGAASRIEGDSAERAAVAHAQRSDDGDDRGHEIDVAGRPRRSR